MTKKIPVSPEWTVAEREHVRKAIQKELDAVSTDLREDKKTTFWDAPALKEMASTKMVLEQLLKALEFGSKEFLQENRRNFSDYIA